jgi:DNA-binding response OmpR family regulator
MENKKIMIVDDEYTIRKLVALTLEDEYEIIKAESGNDALNKINLKPDLIILDVMMPNLDGFSVCEALKSNKETQHIPIIMLTAKHQIEDVKKAMEIGADEYITKPFEPSLLKQRIKLYFEDGKIDRKLFQYGKSIHFIKGRDAKD